MNSCDSSKRLNYKVLGLFQRILVMKCCDFLKGLNYEVLWLFKGFVLWKVVTLGKEEGKKGMFMDYICLIMFMCLFILMNHTCK